MYKVEEQGTHAITWNKMILNDILKALYDDDVILTPEQLYEIRKENQHNIQAIYARRA